MGTNSGAASALVERGDELRTLGRLIDGATEGEGGLVVVEGPPGIGVSALLAAAGEQARARKLRIRIARAGAGGLEPELRAELRTTGPLLVLVDDVAIDGPAVDVLARITPLARRSPALVVAGMHRVSAAAVPEALVGAARTVLSPGPLTVDGVAALLERIAGGSADPDVADAVRTVLGGRPARVAALGRELRRASLEAGAGDRAAVLTLAGSVLASDVAGRVGSRAAREVVEVLALLGDGTPPGRLARVLARPVETIHQELDDLVARDILVRGERPAFLRGAERDAVAQTLTHVRRHALLIAAVAVLAEEGDDEAAGALLLTTPPTGDPDVQRVLRRAATAAMTAERPDVAIRLYGRLLTEPLDEDERGRTLVALGTAQVGSGHPAGPSTLAAALNAARDPRDVAAAAAALGWALAGGLDGQAAARTLQEARDRVREAGGGLDVALDVQIADMSAWDAQLGPARAAAVARLRQSPGSGLARAAVTAAEAVDAVATGRPAAELVELCQRALAGGELADDPRGAPTALALAMFLGYGGRPALGVDHVDHVITRLRAHGPPALVRPAIAFRGALQLMLGRLAPAERDLRAVVDAPWVVRSTPLTMSFLVLCLLERGDEDGAAAALAGLELEGGTLRPSIPHAPFLYARGVFRGRRGDPHSALEDQRECGRRLLAGSWTTPAVAGWRGAAARALVELGRPEEARRLAAEEVALAERLGTPAVLGRALCALAAASPGDRARRLLERAATITQDRDAPLEHVAALVELGAREIDGGAPSAARPRLHLALARARELGAHGQTERAAGLLRAAGGRSRRARPAVTGGLTRAEQRVATLAAAGLTTAEICAELVVSRKTVESHLGAVYRKLGIGSRAQLPDALGRMLGPG